MDASSDFKKTVDIPVPKQLPIVTFKFSEQTLVGLDPIKTLEEVKDERETTAALIALNEMVLHDLDQAIGRASNDLMQLVEEFDSLSLNGGLLAHMEGTVRFMEESAAQFMEESAVRFTREHGPPRGGGLAEDSITEGLHHIKKKLKLLSDTMETRKNALERRE
jgi:hypothetical protein